MINFIISAFDWWLRSPPAICFAFIYVMVRFLFSLFYATKWLLFIFCPWIAWYPSVCQLTGILLKIFHGTVTFSCVGQVTELPWSLSNSTSLSELFTSRSACRRAPALLLLLLLPICMSRQKANMLATVVTIHLVCSNYNYNDYH